MENKKSSDPFTMILNKFARDPNLNDGAYRAYVVLASYANEKSGRAWPSAPTLARDMGCSPKQARRRLRDLLDTGLIKKVEERVGRSTVYASTLDTHDQGGWTRRTTPDAADTLDISDHLPSHGCPPSLDTLDQGGSPPMTTKQEQRTRRGKKTKEQDDSSPPAAMAPLAAPLNPTRGPGGKGLPDHLRGPLRDVDTPAKPSKPEPKLRRETTRKDPELDARAKAIVDPWWKEQDPKPVEGYWAVVTFAGKLLAAGHSDDDVLYGLDKAHKTAVISVKAVKFGLNQRATNVLSFERNREKAAEILARRDAPIHRLANMTPEEHEKASKF